MRPVDDGSVRSIQRHLRGVKVAGIALADQHHFVERLGRFGIDLRYIDADILTDHVTMDPQCFAHIDRQKEFTIGADKSQPSEFSDYLSNHSYLSHQSVSL